MGKYGNSDQVPDHEEDQEQFTPFSELCKFAEEYELLVEIEKPFKEFENLYLKLVHKQSGEEVHRVTIDDIDGLNEEAADVLNELSKRIENWDNT